MTYRTDPDIEFLQNCKSEDLQVLLDILIKDSDGSLRVTEELTSNEFFKKHQPNHRKYWDLIAGELQCFGANSFATMFRGGKGVLYRELLSEVCDKMKVNYNKKSNIELIERNLLMKIMTDSIESMSPEQLKEIVGDLDLNTVDFSKQGVIGALQAAIFMGGFQSYRIALIAANAVAKAVLGSGLKIATNATLTRSISYFAGPIGWALTAGWVVFDISGPATRVTIPAVVQVAFLRAKLKYDGTT